MNKKKRALCGALAGIVAILSIVGCGAETRPSELPSTTHSDAPAVAPQEQAVPADENVSKTTGLRKVSAMASYFGYPDVNKLDSGAQLILIGTPTQNFIERTANNTYYADGNLQDNSTLTEFKIERVIKNQDEIELGETIQIIEPISIIEEADGQQVVVTIEDYVELQKGKTYIIFLRKNMYGQYSVINMNNGRFAIEEGENQERSVMADSNKEAHSEFKEEVLKKYNLNP